MTLTTRQQLTYSVENTELELEGLKSQSQPNRRAIETEEKELAILRSKLEAAPQ